MRFNEWCQKILEQYPSTGNIRWGQAVMNASPSRWRENLPDVWEINSLYHEDVQQWYNHAVKELS